MNSLFNSFFNRSASHFIINQIFFIIFLVSILASCVHQELDLRRDNVQFDLLSQESFSRFNSQLLDHTTKDQITDSIKACHAHKFVKAKKLQQELFQENKENPAYWNSIGLCYLLQDNTILANKNFQIALTLKKTTAIEKSMVINNLGLLFLKLNRYNEAYDSFQKSSKLNPSALTPVFNIAHLEMEFSNFDKAIEHFMGLYQKNRKDTEILYGLSLAYWYKSDFKKSHFYISQIDTQFLNRADIVGLYAMNLMHENELTEALNILQKRKFASSYDSRNEAILDQVKQKIKSLK